MNPDHQERSARTFVLPVRDGGDDEPTVPVLRRCESHRRDREAFVDRHPAPRRVHADGSAGYSLAELMVCLSLIWMLTMAGMKAYGAVAEALGSDLARASSAEPCGRIGDASDVPAVRGAHNAPASTG